MAATTGANRRRLDQPGRDLQADPFTYLRDLYERISCQAQSRLGELLPDPWKTARKPAPTT